MKRDDRDNSKYYFRLADKSIIGSISSQNLIDWYQRLYDEKFMPNKNTGGMFYQIDQLMRKISKKAYLRHNVLLRDERVALTFEHLYSLLKANKRVKRELVEPEKVAKFVYLVKGISQKDTHFKTLADYLMTTMHLGTRAGETTGIQLKDVHLDNHSYDFSYINLHRQTAFIPNSKGKLANLGFDVGIQSWSAKSEAGKRYQRLSSEMEDFFHQAIIDFDAGVRTADNYGNDSIFQNDKSEPYTGHMARHDLKMFSKKYEDDFKENFETDFKHNIHSLRHATTTLLIQNTDGNTQLTSEVVGHAHDRLTRDVYNHPFIQKLNGIPNMTEVFKEVMS